MMAQGLHERPPTKTRQLHLFIQTSSALLALLLSLLIFVAELVFLMMRFSE
jgi:hypothetical protein